MAKATRKYMLVEYPTHDKWIDRDGDCRLTIDPCKYPGVYKCGKCPKSLEDYINKLVRYDQAVPWENNVWERKGIRHTLNGDAKVGRYETDSPDKMFSDSWWFKHLKPIDPATWHEVLKLHECPYAFALAKCLKLPIPNRVLWAPELLMIMVYDDHCYLITATSWHESAEIKDMYEGTGKVHREAVAEA